MMSSSAKGYDDGTSDEHLGVGVGLHGVAAEDGDAVISPDDDASNSNRKRPVSRFIANGGAVASLESSLPSSSKPTKRLLLETNGNGPDTYQQNYGSTFDEEGDVHSEECKEEEEKRDVMQRLSMAHEPKASTQNATTATLTGMSHGIPLGIGETSRKVSADLEFELLQGGLFGDNSMDAHDNSYDIERRAPLYASASTSTSKTPWSTEANNLQRGSEFDMSRMLSSALQQNSINTQVAAAGSSYRTCNDQSSLDVKPPARGSPHDKSKMEEDFSRSVFANLEEELMRQYGILSSDDENSDAVVAEGNQGVPSLRPSESVARGAISAGRHTVSGIIDVSSTPAMSDRSVAQRPYRTAALGTRRQEQTTDYSHHYANSSSTGADSQRTPRATTSNMQDQNNQNNRSILSFHQNGNFNVFSNRSSVTTGLGGRESRAIIASIEADLTRQEEEESIMETSINHGLLNHQMVLGPYSLNMYQGSTLGARQPSLALSHNSNLIMKIILMQQHRRHVRSQANGNRSNMNLSEEARHNIVDQISNMAFDPRHFNDGDIDDCSVNSVDSCLSYDGKITSKCLFLLSH